MENLKTNEKKKNGKKVALFAGAAVLTAALATGAGIAIQDSHVDHRYEVCPITKSLYSIPSLKDRAIAHQTKKLDEAYQKGYSVAVPFYYENYTPVVNAAKVGDTDSYFTLCRVVPISKKNESGEIEYRLPAGYVLTNDESGNLIGLSNDFAECYEEKEFGECIVTYLGGQYYDFDEEKYMGQYFVRNEAILELHK